VNLPACRRSRAAFLILTAALIASAALIALVGAAPVTAPARAATGYVLPSGPFAGLGLYVSPNSAPAVAAATTTDPGTAQLLNRVAGVPQAIWLTGGTPSAAAATVSTAVSAAAPGGKVTEFVVYNIPHRDCTGGYSAGGAADAAAYQSYVAAIAKALTGAHAVVILEPDALAGLDCLSAADQTARLSMVKSATNTLAAKTGVLVYLDAGNAGWQTPSTMVSRLSKAGVANARGFALNVSNYDPTSSEIAYGTKVSALIGWKRFVVDTSRNGTSPRVTGWCNPAGAALGQLPGSAVSYAGVDALLWIKRPGESDGVCGVSAVPAGGFDVNLVLSLAHNAGW
jgi:endoglucanase